MRLPPQLCRPVLCRLSFQLIDLLLHLKMALLSLIGPELSCNSCFFFPSELSLNAAQLDPWEVYQLPLQRVEESLSDELVFHDNGLSLHVDEHIGVILSE